MHITEIEFHRFKKFKDSTIKLNNGFSLLAGSNNSGKTTLLQGLAIWQFCKMVLEMERGVGSLFENYSGQGVGVSDDEFSPINLPNLKHLWTNLKTQKVEEIDGYTLWVGVKWLNNSSDLKKLKFGLSLVNDRLFVKVVETNINSETDLINIIYIPPFAGISSNEQRYTQAMIRKFLGEGIPGAVLRNIILDLKIENDIKRNKEKEEHARTRSSFLKRLRSEDSFEKLKIYLERVFSAGINVKDFNDYYHTYIKIYSFRGGRVKNRFTRFPDYNQRDLMVEGSGFLQWLTVVAFSLSPQFHVIVLDEPDAHLHPMLQNELISNLIEISESSQKQVLFATHSPELLRNQDYNKILSTNVSHPKYLNAESQKVKLLSGIGSDFYPRLHHLKKQKKILFVENESDFNLLKIFANNLEKIIMENFVIWPWASRHSERKHIFLELRKDIPELTAFGISDRDNESIESVADDLRDKSISQLDGFTAKKWKRKHIESYLLCQNAISRAVNKTPDDIKNYILENFGVDISIHQRNEYADVLLSTDGKSIIDFGEHSIGSNFGKNKYDIAKMFNSSEIPQDIIIMIDEFINFIN